MPWELLALIVQAGLLALHFMIFRRPFRSTWSGAAQRSGRYPLLLLCFVLPLAWLNWARQGPLWLASGLEACTWGILSVVAFETFFTVAAPSTRRSRLKILRAAAYSAALTLIVVHSLREIIQDQDVAMALLSSGAVYVGLVLLYDAIFKWPRPSSQMVRQLQSRMRGLAFLLVPGLALYHLLTAWQVVPITRTTALSYQHLLVAVSLAIAGETILFLVFETLQARRPVPQFFREGSRALLYLWLGWAYLHWLTEGDLTALVTSSAFVSVGLGLALKPTLGNLVAGLALRLAKPFGLGDYIEVNGIWGRVHSIDWRSTAICTLQDDLITFPNNFMASHILINTSHPTREHACYLHFQMSVQVSPAQVRELVLEALKSMPEVLQFPATEVYLMEFGAFALKYRIRYWIPDVGRRPQAEAAVHSHLMYVLNRSGIRPQTTNRNWHPLKDSVPEASP